MPPSKPPKLYRLNVHAVDECTGIEILDGNMRPVPMDKVLGDASVDVPAGVYVVRFRQGNSITEKLAVLNAADPTADVRLENNEMPLFASAAPVVNTATTHEWQADPAQQLSRSTPMSPPKDHKGGSYLLLFLRDPFHPGKLPGGVTLHDAHGELLFDLSKSNAHDAQAQWLGAHLNLNPGAYLLRRELRLGVSTEQAVFTQPDWQTQVFLMAGESTEGPKEVARTSIMMAKPQVGFDSKREDFRWTESALSALKRRSNIPGPVRSEMMWAKYQNPMLGIYAGLLHLRREKIEPNLMRKVFNNLFDLVGPLPDVLALGWALVFRHEEARKIPNLMDRLRNPAALAVPPMLRESWEHLLRASASEPALIAEGSLSDRIGGQLVSGTPWVCWLGVLPRLARVRGPKKESVAPPGLAQTAEGEEVGGLKRILMKLLPDSFLEGASKFTLQGALPTVARLLAKFPSAHDLLQEKYFTDVERSVAYWLQPTLDPRLAFLLETDPEVAQAMSAASEARAIHETELLTELNLSATTALRATWGLLTKLFVYPVLPNQIMVDDFIKVESRGNAVFAEVLRELQKKPTRIEHPQSKRTVNMLALVFLCCRGSPAEGVKESASIAQTAQRLAEAGFRVGQHKPNDGDFAAHFNEARQICIGALETAEKHGQVLLSPGWQNRVFAIRYKPGHMFPPLGPARIAIETIMFRNSIAVTGDPVASYALIKLIPTGREPVERSLNLNLALVLDVSGSMYEEDGTGISRLKRVQDAAITAIQQLRPDDTMTLVAFAHNALVLLPPTKIAEKGKIEEVIRQIDIGDIDPGGTAMNDGLRLALDQIEKLVGPNTVSRVLVLTDGETSGESECRALAVRAVAKQIPFILIGVGLDWKANFLEELAHLSAGKWSYIDAEDAAEAKRVFAEEFRTMTSACVTAVEMRVRPAGDDMIKRIRQVAPEIKELKTSVRDLGPLKEISGLSGYCVVADLSHLSSDAASTYLIDLRLPKFLDGTHVVAEIEVTYTGDAGVRETTGYVPLNVTYTSAGSGFINAEVAHYVDEAQIFELNRHLQQALAADNSEDAMKVAEEIAKKSKDLGGRAAKKSMLARQVLEELNAAGRVSKKTQRALEDKARMAEEVPAPD